jgi:hypothetical protein
MDHEHRLTLTLLFSPKAQRSLSTAYIHIIQLALTSPGGIEPRKDQRQDGADAQQIDGRMSDTFHRSSVL